ncbi:MAG: hypothetical protein DI539_17390 [Flavobacterium psychrophilum]|nr:MAG: hypothetical protein DI539_17390 [Flavobacterium psychrophilum]
MSKQSNKSQILSTDEGKTQSNAIEIPSIELPKGGGALKGIDEKFSVNAVNGTSSFAIPLPFSPSRGLTPSLNLSYNSGGGNGVFGLGWSCNVSSIKRKTDKELPRYFDEEDSDTFLFSDTEDLVPEFSKDTDGIFITDTDGNYVINEYNSPDGLFLIRYYKPRTEGMFARIERWTEKASGEIKWRVTTKDNVTTLFGWSNNSRIANPQDRHKVYEWLVEFVFDDKGNTAHYIYKEEDIKGIDQLQIHNKNRIDSNGLIKYTNRYLEKVLYGNKTPYKQLGDAFPFEDDYMFSTVFDYGEYNTLSPYDKINDWNYRNDTFSDYKPGFEIRTTRLCNRVLTFHHFDEYEGLVKSLNFTYDTDIEQDFTFLTAITSYGYIKKTDGSYSHKKLPPMEFGYQKHEWSKEIKSVNIDDLVNAPVGLDESAYHHHHQGQRVVIYSLIRYRMVFV